MRVVVLMSTYQGERFIKEQLDSILSQLPDDGHLLIRDDGSSDQTVNLVKSVIDPRITLTCGPNLGFAQSFFTLMAATPNTAEMIMLSDQDDVWLPQKIERAWEFLKDSGGVPTLYCARQQLVDIHLHPIGLSQRFTRPPSFQNALTENIVTGCTAAFNRAALNLALKLDKPEKVYFHDWWLYLVVSAFGTVVFDPIPSILYRQHGQNLIGMGVGVQRYVNILKFLRKVNWVHIMFDQIGNFRAVHGTMLSVEKRLFLSRFFEPERPASIARLLLTPQRLRQSLLGDVLFRALLLTSFVTGRHLTGRCCANA